MTAHRTPALIAALFALSVLLANLAIVHVGIVPVGFGLMAPAGVYFAGLTFSLRDWLHESGGRRWVLAAVLAGAILSAGMAGPALAAASGAAFLLSELADYAVYAPLRRRGWLPAVAASNVFGLTVDSALFLWLAFGSLAFLPGQIAGKLWMTALTIVIVLAWRRARRAPEVEGVA